MTKNFDDGVTSLDEANLNKMIAGDGTVGPYGVWAMRVRYTGAAWEGVASYGAVDQIANVVFTWDAVNDWLEIDTSSCDNPFGNGLAIPITTSDLGLTTYWTKVNQWSTNETHVQFYNRDATQTVVTTEGTDMDFYIQWWGPVA